MEPVTTAAAFVCLFLGVVCRTALPYLRKVGTEGLTWDNHYAGMALASVVLCLIAAALVFPALPENILVAPLLAFALGFGIDAALIEAGEWTPQRR